MTKVLYVLFFILLGCGGTEAVDAGQLERPAISIEQAIALAKRHVESEKLNVSDSYIAVAEWHARPGLVGFWRIEWRMKKLVKGGYTVVTVYGDGKVEHGFGE